MAQKKLLTREELEKLTTPRLLAYRNSLMEVPEGPSWDEHNVPDRMHKARPEWKVTYEHVKAVLAKREHVAK